jgi:hypothetical protein
VNERNLLKRSLNEQSCRLQHQKSSVIKTSVAKQEPFQANKNQPIWRLLVVHYRNL